MSEWLTAVKEDIKLPGELACGGALFAKCLDLRTSKPAGQPESSKFSITTFLAHSTAE